MLTIPLSAIPAQDFSIVLDGQNCFLSVYQKSTGLYFDVSLDGAPVATTVRCLNVARLIQDRQYEGFVGDFMFVDTQGVSDPDYTGLADRYELVYLEAADLAASTLE